MQNPHPQPKRKALSFWLPICLGFWVTQACAQYYLHFTPPLPADTNGTLLSYQGAWQYTNTVNTNLWQPFGGVSTGQTRIAIPPTVGSPAWVTVRSVGTNGLLGTNSALVLYNTVQLAAAITNTPVIPAAPVAGVITNN